MKHPDRFRSVEELSRVMKQDVDFRWLKNDRQSKVTIVSPHGGLIEPGTSQIAEALAGEEFNLFDFQGLRKKKPWELHVTSTRFRHPALDLLLSNSLTAVSIHGMGKVDSWNIWVGGRNKRLKLEITEALRVAGFSVRGETPIYKGIHPLNFVNLTEQKGVQLELPCDLISKFFEKDPAIAIRKKTKLTPTALLHSFIAALRQPLLAIGSESESKCIDTGNRMPKTSPDKRPEAS